MKVFSIANGKLVAGVSDNDVLGTVLNLAPYDILTIYADQPVDIQGSIDGIEFTTGPVQLEDQQIAAPGTRVLVTAANKFYRVCPGVKLASLKILQNGATPATKCALVASRSYPGD